MGQTMGGQEAAGGDAQSRMVMETAPGAPFVMRQAEFLLEFLGVALDPPTHLGDEPQWIERDIVRRGGQPILQRFGPPSGHSIRSHSSGRIVVARDVRCAGWTRRQAKREDSGAFVPFRQARFRY